MSVMILGLQSEMGQMGLMVLNIVIAVVVICTV